MLRADVYYNTVHISNELENTLGGSGQVASAAFEKLNSNPQSVYNIKNNLFINDRTGGVNGALHLAAHMANAAGSFNADYNTYTSASGYLVKYNGPVFSNISTYIGTIGGGNELNSNDESISFAGIGDHHLFGTSINNTNLQGTMIAGITMDKEGDTRNFPYRGADEEVITCTANPEAGNTYLNYIKCEDAGISYAPVTTNGKHFQWQRRTAGTNGAFVNIAGANTLNITDHQSQPMEYRVVDSCLAGGSPSFSDTITVGFAPPVQITGISQTHNGLVYDFAAVGAQNVSGYNWDFGDGTTTMGHNPQHTYSMDGNYTVTLIAGNSCNADTVTLNLNTLTVHGVNATSANIKIYPNPSVNEIHIFSETDIEMVLVYDITGKFVMGKNVNGLKQTALDISRLGSGIYTVKIQTDGSIYHSTLSVIK